MAEKDETVNGVGEAMLYCIDNKIVEEDVIGDAVENAIQHCIENNIMRDYLENNIEKVKRMLTVEMTERIYDESIKKKAFEERKTQTFRIIAQRMKKELLSNGIIERVTGLTTEEIELLEIE